MKSTGWAAAVLLVASGALLPAGGAPAGAAAQGAAPDTAQLRSGLLGPEENETLTSWTDRWLDGPVQYVVSEEERELYEALDSVAQRLQFIRLFWESRDPTPRDETNEFLEEFERRATWVEEHYGNGEPGWTTIFGRVALVLGTPDRTFQTSEGMGAVNSQRPLVLWSYDRQIEEWPQMENFRFFYRFRKWRLMPHSESYTRGSGRQQEAAWEANSTLDIIPEDFLRVQAIATRDAIEYPANYRGAIDRVAATVAFPDAEIPFGWDARFAPGDTEALRRVDITLNMRMDAFIFHADETTYRTRMQLAAMLLDDNGVPIAEVSEPIVMEVPIDALAARAEEIVDRTISLQAPPGRYTLELLLEDSTIGYRTVYRETIEVPAS